ncbi:hypothetical protein [Chitinophaga rhizophila]|uniref:SGNH/GDSL hydrolase family protein n=1 Tax=Chitinophaga rhizophila TaxID=2866212 RepID=A0ABS7GIT1_9BACT|nr:hypothetical protein [Chitinophaga rhizophila]MBW8687610.1 hypothetical protein [Chitinophaga rhizophila]
MWHFLRRLVMVSFVFSLLVTVLIITGNRILSRKARFEILHTDTLIILGHSHPECAYNDTLIAGAKNLSSSGESYFYTLPKVKNVLAQNPHIKAVFIEFSNNQVAAPMNKWIWGDNYMERQYPIYAPFIASEDRRLLFAHNMSGYITSSSFALKRQVFNILTNNYAYTSVIGGYYYNNVNKLDSLLAIQQQLPVTGSDTSLSRENLRYLKACIDVCLQNGKQVYLVRTPTHPKFPGRRSERVFEQVRREYFNDIPFLDFAAFPIADTEYADLEHLNYYGARRFSIWMNKMLKNGLLSVSEKDRQSFINEHL